MTLSWIGKKIKDWCQRWLREKILLLLNLLIEIPLNWKYPFHLIDIHRILMPSLIPGTKMAKYIITWSRISFCLKITTMQFTLRNFWLLKCFKAQVHSSSITPINKGGGGLDIYYILGIFQHATFIFALNVSAIR